MADPLISLLDDRFILNNQQYTLANRITKGVSEGFRNGLRDVTIPLLHEEFEALQVGFEAGFESMADDIYDIGVEVNRLSGENQDIKLGFAVVASVLDDDMKMLASEQRGTTQATNYVAGAVRDVETAVYTSAAASNRTTDAVNNVVSAVDRVADQQIELVAGLCMVSEDIRLTGEGLVITLDEVGDRVVDAIHIMTEAARRIDSAITQQTRYMATGLDKVGQEIHTGFTTLTQQAELTNRHLEKLVEIHLEEHIYKADTLIVRGGRAYQDGRYDKAEADFTAAEELNYEDYRLYIGLGLIYSHQKPNIRKAAECFGYVGHYARGKDPKSSLHGYMYAARLYAALRDPAQCAKAAEGAHGVSNNSPQVHYLLTMYLAKTGNMTEAAKYTDLTVRYQPSYFRTILDTPGLVRQPEIFQVLVNHAPKALTADLNLYEVIAGSQRFLADPSVLRTMAELADRALATNQKCFELLVANPTLSALPGVQRALAKNISKTIKRDADHYQQILDDPRLMTMAPVREVLAELADHVMTAAPRFIIVLIKHPTLSRVPTIQRATSQHLQRMIVQDDRFYQQVMGDPTLSVRPDAQSAIAKRCRQSITRNADFYGQVFDDPQLMAMEPVRKVLAELADHALARDSKYVHWLANDPWLSTMPGVQRALAQHITSMTEQDTNNFQQVLDDPGLLAIPAVMEVLVNRAEELEKYLIMTNRYSLLWGYLGERFVKLANTISEAIGQLQTDFKTTNQLDWLREYADKAESYRHIQKEVRQTVASYVGELQIKRFRLWPANAGLASGKYGIHQEPLDVQLDPYGTCLYWYERWTQDNECRYRCYSIDLAAPDTVRALTLDKTCETFRSSSQYAVFLHDGQIYSYSWARKQMDCLVPTPNTHLTEAVFAGDGQRVLITYEEDGATRQAVWDLDSHERVWHMGGNQQPGTTRVDGITQDGLCLLISDTTHRMEVIRPIELSGDDPTPRWMVRVPNDRNNVGCSYTVRGFGGMPPLLFVQTNGDTVLTSANFPHILLTLPSGSSASLLSPGLVICMREDSATVELRYSSDITHLFAGLQTTLDRQMEVARDYMTSWEEELRLAEEEKNIRRLAEAEEEIRRLVEENKQLRRQAEEETTQRLAEEEKRSETESRLREYQRDNIRRIDCGRPLRWLWRMFDASTAWIPESLYVPFLGLLMGFIGWLLLALLDHFGIISP